MTCGGLSMLSCMFIIVFHTYSIPIELIISMKVFMSNSIGAVCAKSHLAAESIIYHIFPNRSPGLRQGLRGLLKTLWNCDLTPKMIFESKWWIFAQTAPHRILLVQVLINKNAYNYFLISVIYFFLVLPAMSLYVLYSSISIQCLTICLLSILWYSI